MKQTKEKRIIAPDPVYNSVIVAKFINQIMRKGKKTVARKIVYNSFQLINKKTKKDPLDVFIKAIENASPLLEVKSKRVGGATYQVPMEVSEKRKKTLAMRWIIEAAKKGKKKPIKEKLAEELIEASENRGTAIKKKEDIHRMAEANRAFAHFARR
ncbi:30S ribosomal protein S7 [Dehalococcoidia bacterium]|nr:30S ribosomal protein S7 [Dehalococcoidia bacterium]